MYRVKRRHLSCTKINKQRNYKAYYNEFAKTKRTF